MIPNRDQDLYGWAVGTAQLLKDRKMNEVDFESIIEELEEMGSSNKHAFKSRLAQLIFHLLKWQFQPDFRGRSWNGTIKEQRIRLADLLEDNPSLKPMVNELTKKSYRLSLSLIEKETPLDLKSLSQECPYTFDQLIDESFYPQ